MAMSVILKGSSIHAWDFESVPLIYQGYKAPVKSIYSTLQWVKRK
jgi:hypothetical protein